MSKPHRKSRAGVTVMELLVASVMGVIVLLGTAILLMDTQRGFQYTYDKVYGDVVTNGFVARRMFDSVVRKSSSKGITVDANGEGVEVKYYFDDASTYPDYYAYFYTAGTELKLEQGTVSDKGDKQIVQESTVCGNVSSSTFSRHGNSVQMVLSLNDNKRSNAVVTSAFPHSE